MIQVHKEGKDRSKADSYRPISLTSCIGELVEWLINSRLTWYLEKEEIITPKQAGSGSTAPQKTKLPTYSKRLKMPDRTTHIPLKYELTRRKLLTRSGRTDWN